MSIDEFELKIMDLEQRLRPIADRPVDITSPGWTRRLTQAPHPVDEAGVRSSVEALLDELLAAYQAAEPEARQAMRNLFTEYRAFAWASSLPIPPTNAEDFRRHLLLFSLKDQGRDSRDALLWLQSICKPASESRVDTTPMLRQVAELSSRVNKYGMGSTRDMLLGACQNEVKI